MLFRPKPPQFRAPLARRVRDLELVSSRLIRAGFAGDYQSAFHGRGIEFSQVREYMPGDDIRSIDWNVTARSGVPHVKEFVEERDLTVLLAVDVSASMAFGSVDWRKCDIAAELAAVFAFSAVQNHDRIGLVLYSDRVVQFVPPRRGRAHAQVIVRAAVDAAMRGPAGRADFEQATLWLERANAKRAVVIVVSDFLDSFERPMRRMNRHHDVVAMVVTDPREGRFPSGALARLADAESGREQLVDLGRADVPKRAMARAQQLERRFRAAQVDWMEVSTAMGYERQLLQFFRARSLRR